MRNIERVILHCSATREGEHFTADTIRAWHLARGWRDIGYHYVVLLDGTVESGRPISDIGAHVKGHNQDSIGICYIGGLDISGHPKNTMTREQKYSIKRLCRSLCITLNKPLTLHGHREYSSKACPSFEIAEEFNGLSKWMANPGQ